ncbi:hypothetical protein [Pectinatus frisingensis]
MAQEINCSPSTILYELSRGTPLRKNQIEKYTSKNILTFCR